EVRDCCEGAKPTVGYTGRSPFRCGRNEIPRANGCARKKRRLRSRQEAHPRTAGRAGLHGELCLENLFEQIALVDTRRRADAQALPPLQQHHLIGVFPGEVEFVRDNYDGVAIFRSEAAERLQEIDLRADVEMQCGFVEEK